MPISLQDLAALPLDRSLVSARIQGVDADGQHQLAPVGLIDIKAKRLSDPQYLCLAVSHGQTGLPPLLPQGKPCLQAQTLDELSEKLHAQLGPAVYGEITPLPAVLQQPSYAGADYFPLQWLNAGVAEALADHDRGYLFVLGGAARGKTSWALQWQRESLGRAAPTVTPSGLPPLAGTDTRTPR